MRPALTVESVVAWGALALLTTEVARRTSAKSAWWAVPVLVLLAAARADACAPCEEIAGQLL